MRRHDVPRALVGILVALFAFGRLASAQGPERVVPTCIQNVGLPTADDPDRRATLVLRDGRIEAVLAADAEAPPGARLVDGSGLTALPAFLDAYTQKGLAMRRPVKDQDRPLDEGADVRIDMRLANRKGIQPAFRAADALAFEPDTAEPWREQGYGAALVAPSGELLAGHSALASTRDAANRELVIAPEVFAHAAFQASGSGYPSTLMGYIAQLRQFFLDVRWHAELQRRHGEGRPGARPAHDADLEAARSLLGGTRRLACEAESARDFERWLGLADQFGLQLLFVGGNDAARVADTLRARDLPVILTLNWGKEVKDPLAEEKAEEKDAEDAAEEEPEAEGVEFNVSLDQDADQAELVVELVDALDAAPTDSDDAEASAADDAADEDDAAWEYETPLAIRVEQRRLWEERRDVALRLAEAGVRFTFGTGDETPKKLLGKVRTLVEEGLPRETALEALTTGAARLLGVERRLGRIAPGFDATLTLWTADPLTEKDAQAAWIFLDGPPLEYEVEPPDPAAQGEPQDAAGAWVLSTEMMGETRESTLALVQDDEGGLTGTLTYTSPDGAEETTTVEGQVRGATLSLSGAMTFGDTAGTVEISGTMDGDALTGTASYAFPFSDEPFEASVSGTRTPEVLLELHRHSASCHEDHSHLEGLR